MAWPCFRRGVLLSVAALCTTPAFAFELSGDAIQGGLIFGQALPGSRIQLDDQDLLVAADGRFVFGFDRDASGTRVIRVEEPGKTPVTKTLEIAARQYNVERVDGLPPRTVTPDPEALERIRQEAAMVSHARARRDSRADFASGFAWPAHGRLSGFYGSQRILNGEPGRPHYGLDVAAPTGSPVLAPADGVITLTHPDMYYSGGTIVLDHGLGLSSTFLHLSEILVEAGMQVKKGDLIARIGSSGRATGPHLDWRMNWLDQRVDPQPLVADLPLAEE